MAVIDASVLVDYLAGGADQAAIRQRLYAERLLWAPHLVDAEVGHALRRGVANGAIRQSAARAALEDLADLPIRRTGHLALMRRAWELRANVSFYDALYVALAERLDEPLVTLDGRLAGAAGVRAEIEVIA